jgi:demethoxyubiquinone hydroxylase (CLK1/Coq7/Cat5 family)
MARRPVTSFEALVALLRRAHAGELAAFLAYEGHWRSLRDVHEAADVRAIAVEEWIHRRELRRTLDRFERRPLWLREAVFWLIGTSIGALCRVGGWFFPMYGAGFLESGNVEEYERAARLAVELGEDALAGALREMALVEARHEAYFRERVQGHWLSAIVPLWRPPVIEIRSAASRTSTSTSTSTMGPGSTGSRRCVERGLEVERAFGRSRKSGPTDVPSPLVRRVRW